MAFLPLKLRCFSKWPAVFFPYTLFMCCHCHIVPGAKIDGACILDAYKRHIFPPHCRCLQRDLVACIHSSAWFINSDSALAPIIETYDHSHINPVLQSYPQPTLNITQVRGWVCTHMSVQPTFIGCSRRRVAPCVLTSEGNTTFVVAFVFAGRQIVTTVVGRRQETAVNGVKGPESVKRKRGRDW